MRISPDVLKQEKIAATVKNEVRESVNKNDGKKGNSRKRSSGKSTPTDKMFDINDFFNEVDYYPPHLVSLTILVYVLSSGLLFSDSHFILCKSFVQVNWNSHVLVGSFICTQDS